MCDVVSEYYKNDVDDDDSKKKVFQGKFAAAQLKRSIHTIYREKMCTSSERERGEQNFKKSTKKSHLKVIIARLVIMLLQVDEKVQK